MSGRIPAYQDPALHFDALRLAALREGGRIEKTLAIENGRGMLIRANAHVHSAHAVLFLLEPACSPLPAHSANRLDGPCLTAWSMYLESNSRFDDPYELPKPLL